MFKGLRTKIENEKQTGTGKQGNSLVQDKVSDTVIQPHQKHDSLRSNPNIKSNNNIPVPKDSTRSIGDTDKHCDLSIPESKRSLSITRNTSQSSSLSTPDTDINKRHNDGQDSSESQVNQIAELRLQLSTITAERDESNEQNAQLYQLIEKLRRNLEVERETNASLKLKLNDYEQALKTKDCEDGQKLGKSAIPNISFDPDKLAVNDNKLPEDVEILQNQYKELQRDLSKKNRQLKIYQQNINDMRKTLQREISDHNKSRDEIHRLEIELKELEASRLEPQTNADYRDIAFNGYSIDDVSTTRDSNARKQQSLQNSDGASSDKSGGEPLDERAVSSSKSNKITQPDNISYKSTISVDEIESNDLRKSGKTNKEVSHEYLRNVLYRFLTSTDMETSQRMVTAISVLMNFSQDQSAAIKKALQTRSSWLRLK